MLGIGRHGRCLQVISAVLIRLVTATANTTGEAVSAYLHTFQHAAVCFMFSSRQKKPLTPPSDISFALQAMRCDV